MQVILQEKVEKLGEAFEIINVREGFARNFLIPRKLAVQATDKNRGRIEFFKKQREKKFEKTRQEAQETAKKLEAVSITLAVKVGEGDKMFGSITLQQIHAALAKEGFEGLPKKNILLEAPIKALGIYNIPVKLEADVMSSVKVWVVKE